MDSNQLLLDLRYALQGLRETSRTTVQVETLLQVLDDWEKAAESSADVTATERASRLEQWKAQLAVSSATWLEMFKAVLETGMTALKSSIVINGGAAATLLALLADGLKANGSGNWGLVLTPLGWAWMCFMCGLGLAGVATGARYLSQAMYAESFQLKESRSDKFHRLGSGFRNAAVLLAVSSYALFFAGAYKIFAVILNSAALPK